MNTTSLKPGPLYLQVKRHIEDQIAAGVWSASERVPSENQLIESLGVSKMTVNRALRTLADEGTLTRVVGVGSFVAETKIDIHPLEVRNIADEIEERGHVHTAQIILLREERPSARLLRDLDLGESSAIFHSTVLHHDNGAPVQLEDRWVNPEVAPDYLSQDFTQITPTSYLMAAAPLQEVEHSVEAAIPGGQITRMLNMGPNEPCLIISRRTWALGKTACGARLYHPGSTYRLGQPKHAYKQEA